MVGYGNCEGIQGQTKLVERGEISFRNIISSLSLIHDAHSTWKCKKKSSFLTTTQIYISTCN